MDPRIQMLSMAAGVVDGRDFETIRFPTDEIKLRVTNSGDVQVIEYESWDREGGPPHSHPWHEIEYVVEGKVEFFVGGEWIAGGPGTVQVLPSGSAHTMRVPEGTARLLMVTIGPPYDGFGREIAELYETHSSLANVVEVATRHGVRLAD